MHFIGRGYRFFITESGCKISGNEELMTKKQKKVLYRIILSAIVMAVLLVLPFDGVLKAVLFLVPYLVIGYDILRKAVLGVIHGEVFDENFLMAVATIGAMCLGICRGCGGYAVLSDRRIISELCSGKEQKKYICANGYPAGLCKY